tara:strand:+ start:284 stop:1063 length:780 start_codon:yes stop_codon:yes gene_type:complete
MSLIITNWLGRTSNNILQIIRAINYGYINNFNHIVFPNHNLLNNNEINIDTKSLNNNNIKNTFFYTKELNLQDPSPKIMKYYFNKYIQPIFKLNFSKEIINNINNINDLYIHIRSGDCFTLNAHKMYVPPPFSYYTNIIKNKSWNKIIVVYEDDKNPCINLLKNKNYNNIEFHSSTLENDLNILSKCQNLVVGFGTFGLLIYFLSNNIKNLYIPDYAYNEMPQGDWDLNLNIINLPNYIKCGEWKISNENINKLINYKI